MLYKLDKKFGKDPKKKKQAAKTEKAEKKIPYHHKPDNMTLDEWQAALRRQYVQSQNFKVENLGDSPVFSDYLVYNPESGKTYKVAIRSEHAGLNFCSCPDFKINLLGTCKHIEYVFKEIEENPKRARLLRKGNVQYYSSLSLRYGAERKVYLRIGERNHDEIAELASKYFLKNGFLKDSAFGRIEKFLEKIVALDPDFRTYQDAMDYIIDVRTAGKRRKQLQKKYPLGALDPALDGLINAKLYPYQKEGVIRAAMAGRCLIADEMGLGKTVQALATVEILAREFGAERVLIVCPTSLKYQWKSEIERFTQRGADVVEGGFLKRCKQYESASFFKITSYNSVQRDISSIEKFAPDVVILDEAQRIKNWKTKTAQAVKQIQSEFAIVLTGTPLENRLEELHSIVEFIDRYKLGALFRFLAEHQITDDTTRVIGYKDLNKITATLSDILVRRKKADVLTQLPERIDQNFFVPATSQQMSIHQDFSEQVARLHNKWKRNKFLSEKDRERLILSLNCMRMVCDSTYILDQSSRHDTKIEELMNVLGEILESGNEKVVVFSQWERMTRIIASELDKIGCGYEYLHGGVPSAKRKVLLQNFASKPESRVFLSTDAGGVGLNLQAANNLINMDIPWNPAVLEQRIARVHRLGQNKHVNVLNFVTKDSIEERMLSLIKFKKSVFAGVLDNGDDQVFADNNKFKRLMETVGTLTDAPFAPGTSDEEEPTEIEVYGQAETTESQEAPTPAEAENQPIAAESAPESQAAESEPATTLPEDPMPGLIVSGIDFLQKLSKTLANPGSGKALVESLVRKDKDTGEMSLNIPIKDEAVLTKAVDALDALLKVFAGR